MVLPVETYEIQHPLPACDAFDKYIGFRFRRVDPSDPIQPWPRRPEISDEQTVWYQAGKKFIIDRTRIRLLPPEGRIRHGVRQRAGVAGMIYLPSARCRVF